ncbi:MAG: LytTR family DNA-binding domain-containing protein [Cytophagales bacterium]|nr:LytTR family DNA-binding domain-containing protein [Cytophagales bacterium]
MIKCLIIEDEPLAQDLLRQFVSDHPELELVGSYDNPMETISLIESSEVDLLLLDINLPKISGINFYNSLSRKPLVIFTTAYTEFAVEGFEIDAIDYLVKPFPFERFLKAITRAKEKLSQIPKADSQILVIKADKKIYRIPHDQLHFIESLRDFVKIHTNSGAIISSDTLRSLNESLPGNSFLRIHKSYIVNLDKIEFMEGNQVSIKGKKLPVGQAYRDEIAKNFRK